MRTRDYFYYSVAFLAMMAAVIFAVDSVADWKDRRDAARQARAEQIASDAQMCRLVTGIDDRFHVRRLTAACSHEVVEKSLAEGMSRGAAFDAAVKSCQHDYSSCERVLNAAEGSR